MANSMVSEDVVGQNRALSGTMTAAKRRNKRRQISVGEGTYLPKTNISYSLKANLAEMAYVPSHLQQMQKTLHQSREDRLLENYFGARFSGSRSLT